MKKVILIDGNNILYRSYFATAYTGNFMKNSKGFPTNALYGFINMVNKIINEETPEYIMIAFDKGKTFRHEKFEVYKGGRDETPSELKMQFPISRQICEAMGIKHFEIENYEADDIIGTFAKKINESNDYTGLIVSSDKDLLQLITDKVKVKLLKTKDYILMDEEEFTKTYQVEPIKMIDIKALMGDASDNIPGVKGIGEKTAINLLAEYHSLDNIYKNIENIKGKTKEKLLADKENAYLSYEIATIYNSVPIDDNIENIKYLGTNENYNKILSDLEFYSLLKKENNQKSKKEIDYKIIKDLNELKLDSEYSIYLENLGYNYHKSTPLGVSISTKTNNYYIPINLLENTDIFCDNIKKYTYDLKKLLITFNKLNIKIDNKIDDLMLIGYLLNQNIKNDISYLANTKDYDIAFYDKIFGSEITIHPVEETIFSKETIKKSYFILNEIENYKEELKQEEMLELYENIELPLVYVLVKMEENGFKVDIDYLLNMQVEIKNKLENLEKEIYTLANQEFNINSPKQLGKVLFEDMQIPYPKRIKDNNYSTSKEILDKLSDNYQIVEKILEYRMLSKIMSNYIVGIINEVGADSKIHTIFNQTLTRTGRLSSEAPNLQNIPIRTEIGKLIRKAFLPSHNSIIMSSDYSQIELRIFAHMSKAENLVTAFKNDLDIHTKTASDIYNVPLNEVDKEMRRSAKAVNFGILYGISSYGLSEDLGIDFSLAKNFIDHYLETFPGIKEYMDKTIQDAKKLGYVKTMYNRKRIIDELKNPNYLIRQSGERMALNTPVQGTASDILKLAMIKINNKMEEMNLNSKMIVQVHDELVFDVMENEAEIMQNLIREEMENIVKLDVPLKVEIEYGKNWYEAK